MTHPSAASLNIDMVDSRDANKSSSSGLDLAQLILKFDRAHTK
jgi:hypothetical protein